MSDIGKARRALVARILEGDTAAAQAQRRAAFDNDGLEGAVRSLVDKVAMCSSGITDADIEAVKAAGLSEDQIFELVVCAAIGQATREYDTALTALVAATGEA